MKKYICVTKDAYKLLVSPETKGKFEENAMIQLNMSDEAIISKLKKNKDFNINDIHFTNGIGLHEEVTISSF